MTYDPNVVTAQRPYSQALAREVWEKRHGWIIPPRQGCPVFWLIRRHDPDRVCCRSSNQGGGQVFDHVYRLQWAQDLRRHAVLTQPYVFDDVEADYLTAWCARRDISWRVTGEGWWWPDTIAVVLTPTGQSPRFRVWQPTERPADQPLGYIPWQPGQRQRSQRPT